MCGLIGYIGNNAVAPTLLSGLKSLEYRGYDSAGIALNDNNEIDVFKAEGKLENLRKLLEAPTCKRFAPRLGHRTHPLGNARQSHNRKRASSPFQRRQAGTGT